MSRQDQIDIQYMKRALVLAKNGLGTVAPNPMVGAVVVKDGIILGEGWHERPGQPHAEPNAIANCQESVEGATVYVTLEPCCHTNKRTPPCTNLLIAKKVARVVIATLDPNPSVAGNGEKILEDAGIEVKVGVLEKESQKLNEIFFKNILTKMPYVHLKMAQTLDGKLATMSGDSKWITDELARTYVHELRLQYDAVMVGRNTLNNDNPSLNIRMGIDNKGKTPLRLIVGSIDKMNFENFVFEDQPEKTILVTTIEDYQNAADEKVALITDKNIRVVYAGIKREQFDMKEAMSKLGEMGVTSILVEGGGTLAKDLLENNLADKLTIFVAPKILGLGTGYYDQQVDLMADALSFENVNVSTLGKQAMFEMYPMVN
jgi:diaminohydroxyphosphoribosylaminopyrimidine deaminase/5-amino-6-(5-phosphoribosylamino)uracil reductase